MAVNRTPATIRPPAPPTPDTRALRAHILERHTAGGVELERPGRGALELAPFVPWQRFAREHRFEPGEHITLIGRTGRGKSTLATRGLLPYFPFVVVLGTKREDPGIYPYLLERGYRMTTDPRLDARKYPKVIYRPGPFGISDEDRKLQAARFAAVLDVAYAEGWWAIDADEIAFLIGAGLGGRFEDIWRTGRSLKLTLIANTQNPVAIPRPAFDQITHLFVWRQVERDRVRRTAEIMGDYGELAIDLLPHLPPFEALYVNTDTGEMLRTRYPLR